MIFSKNSRKAPHLLSLLVAFAVAVGMWYVVSVRDRLEVQLEVGIEYNGIPSGLVVTDGLVSKVQVRLRGPEILLRSPKNRTVGPCLPSPRWNPIPRCFCLQNKCISQNPRLRICRRGFSVP